MPKATPNGPKQCTFRESGRRCMRNASSGSPFCRAHTLVAKDVAAKASAQRSGLVDTATDILQDVIAGRGVSREKVAKAINQGVWGLGGDYARFSPDLEQVDFGELFIDAAEKAGGAARAKFHGAKNFTPPPGWFRDTPREDPEVAQRRELEAKARQVLGFSPTDAITSDVLRAKKRELAKKFHPDRFATDPGKQKAAAAKMSQINDAVDVLEAGLKAPV